MGFLLHGGKFRVMEKKLTNSGPFRESTGKHSIYTFSGVTDRRCAEYAVRPLKSPKRFPVACATALPRGLFTF
jgi:hypothetical protein